MLCRGPRIRWRLTRNRVLSAQDAAEARRTLALSNQFRGPVERLIFFFLPRVVLLFDFDFFTGAIIHLLVAITKSRFAVPLPAETGNEYRAPTTIALSLSTRRVLSTRQGRLLWRQRGNNLVEARIAA